MQNTPTIVNVVTVITLIAVTLLGSGGWAQSPYELRLGDAEGVFDSLVEVPLTISSAEPFDGLSAVFELDTSGGEIVDLRVDPSIETAEFVEVVTRASWAALGVVRSFESADVFPPGEDMPLASVVIQCGPPAPEPTEASIGFVDNVHSVLPTTETLSNGISIDAQFVGRDVGLSLVPGTVRCIPGCDDPSVPCPTDELTFVLRVLDPASRLDAETEDLSHVTVGVATGHDSAEVTVSAVLVSALERNQTGAEAWSLSVVVEPCFNILDATTDDTVAAPAAPGSIGIRESGFERTEVVDPTLPQNDGRHGVVSAVALSTTAPIYLPPIGESLVLRITGLMDSSSIDNSGDRSPDACHLRPLSSAPWLEGSGEPVATIVTVDSVSRTPSTRGIAITLEGRDTWFVRGDTNQSGQIDISDGVFVLSYLFRGGDTPSCLDAADANDDGRLDISDATRIFGWLFVGLPPPPPPSPSRSDYFASCGPDPTTDPIDCELSLCDS